MGSKSIHDPTYPTIEDGLNGAKNWHDVYISKGLDTLKNRSQICASVGASNDPNK